MKRFKGNSGKVGKNQDKFAICFTYKGDKDFNKPLYVPISAIQNYAERKADGKQDFFFKIKDESTKKVVQKLGAVAMTGSELF